MADLVATSTPALAAVTPHPLYQAMQRAWTVLAHAAEGTGGFSNGTYLIAHPREWLDHKAPTPTQPTPKLRERRALARYEHWPRTILSLLAGGLFRVPPTRRIGDGGDPTHPLLAWWRDVDGHGTNIDGFLRQSWDQAAIFGHCFLVVDRPNAPAETAADARAPYLRRYAPLDVPDWLTDDTGALTAVRLLEGVPRTAFDGRDGIQVRDLTASGWRVVQQTIEGKLDPSTAHAGDHDYAGALPVVVLYGQRPMLTPVVGQSVFGDPKLIVDQYNLVSEHRELLRKQTFAILNIPLGTGDAQVQVSEAQAMLGEASGTANVAFTPLQAAFLSPDKANVDAYAEEREYVVRSLFRMAGLPWESDSRDVESAESRRLKREDLNQTLASYADQVEAADRAIAQLWFRATYGDKWQAAWDAAKVTIAYPDTFDSEVLDDTLNRAALAIGLRLGKTATATVRKQVVSKLLADQPDSTVQQAHAEIDAMPDPEEERAEQRSLLAQSLQARASRPGAFGADPEEAADA